MTALLAAARAIHFASLMAIFGGTTYAALLRRSPGCEPPRKPVHVLFLVAAVIALASGIVWFCLVAGQMSGRWQDSVDPAILQMAALDTRFGRIFLARAIGLIALCVVVIGKLRSNAIAVPVLGGLLLASLAPIGHAAAGSPDIVTPGAINDAVHLLTAGFWLGGLILLGFLVRRYRSNPAALIVPLRVFSLWGSAAVALLVVSGAINAVCIVPMAQMSLRNPYFALFLTKIALALTMIGLASLNRWRFAPALPHGEEGAARHLAISVGVETLLAFVIVGIVGYLGTMAPY